MGTKACLCIRKGTEAFLIGHHMDGFGTSILKNLVKVIKMGERELVYFGSNYLRVGNIFKDGEGKFFYSGNTHFFAHIQRDSYEDETTDEDIEESFKNCDCGGGVTYADFRRVTIDLTKKTIHLDFSDDWYKDEEGC